MDRRELARHLARSFDALGQGYLFYMREELGPHRTLPFGVTLPAAVDELLGELWREDERHMEDLLAAIERMGEKVDFSPHFPITSFYYNYLEPTYLVRVILRELEKDTRRFEEASKPIASDPTAGPLVGRILAEKKKQIERLRAHAPTAEPAAK